MSIGIYRIINNINGKVYIGQSTDIEKRWIKHKNAPFNENSNCYNTPFSRAIRKYGTDVFSFEIIEQCLNEELNEKEIYWISFYNSTNKEKGYNICLGGNNTQHANKIELDLLEQIIDQLVHTSLTQEEIAEKYDLAQSTISMINTGSMWQRSDINYPIRNNEKIIYNCIDCNKIISSGCLRCVKCQAKARQIVQRPDREELKKLIRNNSFVNIGKQYGVHDNTIRKWCKSENLPYQAREIKKLSDLEWELIQGYSIMVLQKLPTLKIDVQFVLPLPTYSQKGHSNENN